MATDGPFSEDETQLHPRSPSEHGCPGAGCARDGSDEAPPPPVTVSEVVELVREIDKHYLRNASFVVDTPEKEAMLGLALLSESHSGSDAAWLETLRNWARGHPQVATRPTDDRDVDREPLLKLGPGGEYVKEVWPEDL